MEPAVRHAVEAEQLAGPLQRGATVFDVTGGRRTLLRSVDSLSWAAMGGGVVVRARVPGVELR